MTNKVESHCSSSISAAMTACRTLESLPQELLAKIYENLSPRDLQETVAVSLRMRTSVLTEAGNIERSSIKRFIKDIICNLDPVIFSDKIASVAHISDQIAPQGLLGLALVKRNILGFKALLVDELKTIDKRTLSVLSSKTQTPYFFGNIFSLVDIEQRIDAAHFIPQLYQKFLVLKQASVDLIKERETDRSMLST